MPRGSDKHGPRIDHELDRETKGLVQGAPVHGRRSEVREPEAPDDREPGTDTLLQGGDRPGDLTHDQLELRSEIAASIQGSVFPATRDELLESARQQRAREPILQLLEQLPADTYENTASVWTALGGRIEGDRSRR